MVKFHPKQPWIFSIGVDKKVLLWMWFLLSRINLLKIIFNYVKFIALISYRFRLLVLYIYLDAYLIIINPFNVINIVCNPQYITQPRPNQDFINLYSSMKIIQLKVIMLD